MGVAVRAMLPIWGEFLKTAKDYSVHMEELGWLVQNHGASMTPEQLQKAIADYTAEKNKSEPGWEAKGKALQDKLAEQGATLQTQLDALRALPAGTPGRDDAIAGALNDPAVGLALNTAWEKKPQLLQGAKGDGLLGFFADPTVKGSAKLSDTGRKLFTDVATQYMKHNVAGALETFNPADPASVAATREAVGTLRNSRLAAVLGVQSPADACLRHPVAQLRGIGRVQAQAGGHRETEVTAVAGGDQRRREPEHPAAAGVLPGEHRVHGRLDGAGHRRFDER